MERQAPAAFRDSPNTNTTTYGHVILTHITAGLDRRGVIPRRQQVVQYFWLTVTFIPATAGVRVAFAVSVR